MSLLPPIRGPWLARRRRLHEAFLRVCEPPDASWLPRMGRRQERWTAREVAALWAESPRRLDACNHVYVHVPFCKSICHFCNYDRLRPSHPEQLRRWQRHVVASIEALAPSLRGIPFHTLYFGGGTPSVLPAEVVREVVTVLERSVDLQPDASRFFEMDPAVMSPAKMAAWRESGFAHASFGIQTLDPQVNEAHERGRQDRALIAHRFAELRENGFPDVSCDFLFGLAGTTVGQILAEIEEVLVRHQPQWIDVYQLVPTPAYVTRHFGGEIERFWEHLRPFQEEGAAGLRRIAAATGYGLSAGQDHRFSLHRRSALGGPNHSPHRYTQLVADQHRPMSLLAFGPSARSSILGEAWMTYEDPPLDAGHPQETAIWEGCRVDMDDESRCYLIYVLRDGDRVSRALFQHIFGADLCARAPVGIAALLAEGIGHLSPEALSLRRASRRARVADLLWLVEEERIERELAKTLRFDLGSEAIWRRLHPLQAGADVGGLALLRAEEGRLVLQAPGGVSELVLRCTPPLEGREAPGLVLESSLPADVVSQQALRRAAAALRRLMARPA